MGCWEAFDTPNPYPDIQLRERIWNQRGSTYFQTSVELPDEAYTVELTVCLDEFLPDTSLAGVFRLNEFMDKQREKIRRRAIAIRTISGRFVAAMRRLEAEFRPRTVSA